MPRRPEPHWHPRRGRWYACLGDPGANGRAREVYAPESIGERDKARAWEWFRAAVAARQPVATAGDLTVEWAAEHYLAWCAGRVEEGKLAPSEYANKARHLGIAAELIGRRPLATLEPDDLTAMGEHLVGAYAPAYARNVCRTASAAIGWALRGRGVKQNPAKGFRAPSVPRSPARFATRSEAAAFVGHWRRRTPRDFARGTTSRLTLLLVRALIRTGARPKELCRLQWADIRWDGWTSAGGHACAKAVLPPDRWKAGRKTGKPRTIYFTPALTHALRRIRDRGAPHATWVFVHGAGRAGMGAMEPWADGSALSQASLRVRRSLIAHQESIRGAIRAGKKVKVSDRRLAAVEVLDAGHNRLTSYRWRHTAISSYLMLGVDVPTVAELTGTSPDMIFRHYGHLLDSHLAAAAEKMVGRRSSGK